MSNKKSQVDVAVTIGSIIIPVAVLFGALIFTWAMISYLSNAGKIASMVAYDVATMADVAYSVPDNIKIMYSPPPSCTITDGKVVCFKGFMNITNFIMSDNLENTEYPIFSGGSAEKGTRAIPKSVEASMDIYFSEDTSKEIDIVSPINAVFSAFATLRDHELLSHTSVPLQITDAIILEKTRVGFHDTLWPYAIEKDPLEIIVKESYARCKGSDSTGVGTWVPFRENMFLKASGTELCLYKAKFNPDPREYMAEEVKYETVTYDDGSTEEFYDSYDPYSTMNYVLEDSKIYCFDFNSIPGCTFKLSDLNSATAITDPAGEGGKCVTMSTNRNGNTVDYTNIEIHTPTGDQGTGDDSCY